MTVRTHDIPASTVVRIASALTKGSDPIVYARRRWPSAGVADTIEKAAVAGVVASDATVWLEDGSAREFMGIVRARTILGRLASRFRRVAFKDRIAVVTGSGSFGWCTGGRAIPVSKPTFTPANLDPFVAGGMVPVSDDLLELASPAAEQSVRDHLARGLAAFEDSQLVDPSNTGTSDVAPASITAGGTPLASTGDASIDLQALLGAMGNLEDVAIIASEQVVVAWHLSLRAGSIPNGMLFGVVPVIVSGAAGTNVVAVRTSGVLYADDGEVAIGASQNATLEMDTEPTHNSGTPTATTLVSMFQANMTAIRVLHRINWSAPRNAADVKYITGASYEYPGS